MLGSLQGKNYSDEPKSIAKVLKISGAWEFCSGIPDEVFHKKASVIS